MPTPQEQFTELAGLTQLFLKQNFTTGQRLFSDTGTFAFFRDEVARRGTPKVSSSPKAVEKARPSQTVAAPPCIPVAAKPVAKGPPAVEKKEVPSKPPQQRCAAPSPKLPERERTSIVQEAVSAPKLQELEALSLAEVSPLAIDDLTDVLESCRKLFPRLTLHDTIPSDTDAQRLRFRWKERLSVPVVVLVPPEKCSKADHAFLLRVAAAITAKLAPAQVVDHQQAGFFGGWQVLLQQSALKLVVSSEGTMKSIPALAPLLGDKTVAGKTWLPMAAPAVYGNSPAKKQELWHALQRLLLPSQRP